MLRRALAVTVQRVELRHFVVMILVLVAFLLDSFQLHVPSNILIAIASNFVHNRRALSVGDW
jgi:hypothetical protein